MASGFDGWWVNGKTGQGRHVVDHGADVIHDPEAFGLSDQDIKALVAGQYRPGDTSRDSSRYALLRAVMAKGWVRIRAVRGSYAIELLGKAATKLRPVMAFMRKAGVGPYAEIRLFDLASDFKRTYPEGMADLARDLKAGRVPDVAGPAVGTEAKAQGAKVKLGVPASLPDQPAREVLRQRIGAQAGIADRAVEESRKGLRKPVYEAVRKRIR
jgi:hypothetical protein